MQTMNIVKKVILALLLIPALSLTGAAPTAMAADACDADKNGKVSTQEAISCGSQKAGGASQTPAQAEKSINDTIASIVNILSIIIAIIAVIMIIIGGFRYITSGGAADKVTSAKNTILYAIIGLIIVALAQTIVRFVINQAVNDSPKCVSGKWDSGPNKDKKCP
ncbi:MAG: pilin [Candidatus Saccharimonadales bacterium]